MPKRAERSEPFELEFRSSAAPHGSRNIDGGGSGLANGMLGRRRHRCTCHRLDGGAVTERPDLPFMILQLQTPIDEQFAALLRAIEVLNYWRKCRRHSGDKRFAGDLGAGLQYRSFRRGRLEAIIENDLDPTLAQNSLGKNRQRLRHFRQNTIAGLNDHTAMRFISQAQVILFHRTHEVIQFGHHFNAREAASPDNECKELATQFRVPLDIGFLENVNQVIAQDHGIRKRPKRHCVFHHAGHAVKVGDTPERNDQVIVFELEVAWTEAGADGDDLIFQIYIPNLPHDQVGARAEAPNGRNDIGQTDRSRNDIREHRLVDPIVFTID
jgi:hypothetical protein